MIPQHLFNREVCKIVAIQNLQVCISMCTFMNGRGDINEFLFLFWQFIRWAFCEVAQFVCSLQKNWILQKWVVNEISEISVTAKINFGWLVSIRDVYFDSLRNALTLSTLKNTSTPRPNKDFFRVFFFSCILEVEITF